MKILTQVLLAITICLFLSSCKDLFGDDEDPKVAFALINKDNTVFTKIELFSKNDSLGVPKYTYLDSKLESDYTDHKIPTKDIPSFVVQTRNLKGLENGTFEIRATKADSSQLVKEFGMIKSDQTQRYFYIELTNNEIFVK